MTLFRRDFLRRTSPSDPYWAISFWWPFGFRGHRWVFVRQMPRERALWIGRHLWRLKYIGARYFQVEEGRFPSSIIPTQDEPVTRTADSLSFPVFPLNEEAWAHMWHERGVVYRSAKDVPEPPEGALFDYAPPVFKRDCPAWERGRDGRWHEVEEGVSRSNHYAEKGDGKPCLLLEGSRTNYALHSAPPPPSGTV